MKEILETPVDKPENEFDATVDAKEDTVQSPRQVVYEESDGIIEEENSLDDDIHKSSSLGDELASATPPSHHCTTTQTPPPRRTPPPQPPPLPSSPFFLYPPLSTTVLRDHRPPPPATQPRPPSPPPTRSPPSSITNPKPSPPLPPSAATAPNAATATFFSVPPLPPTRMSASQRKGKGKATGKRKRGVSSQSIIALMHNSSWWEKNITQQEKADQLLPANDPLKFANRYCELKYPTFANSRNLYLERTLKIPEALQ
ncbi:formin-like protein 3 [Arachis stenosperma]|uniref:formin-like protein 3 n=1 Tax=Arachis stenosperma TaxID=217475 RepID=UPI0025AD4B24|nr:formin-like protein 3 [Arachis stenosperma]